MGITRYVTIVRGWTQNRRGGDDGASLGATLVTEVNNLSAIISRRSHGLMAVTGSGPGQRYFTQAWSTLVTEARGLVQCCHKIPESKSSR